VRRQATQLKCGTQHGHGSDLGIDSIKRVEYSVHLPSSSIPEMSGINPNGINRAKNLGGDSSLFVGGENVKKKVMA